MKNILYECTESETHAQRGERVLSGIAATAPVGSTQRRGGVAGFCGLAAPLRTPVQLTLVEQYAMQRGAKTLRIDGALLDSFNLVYGYWEAKDSKDDLPREVYKKF